MSDFVPRELPNEILSEIERVIVGKRHVLELLLIGILAEGHVLINDYPGLGKTLMARSMAQATGLLFGRVQFSPDLVPSDITGSSIFDQRTGQFEFRQGPIFTNILLADEINRAPGKTQAALLEAMQEHQVTADGTTYPLPHPFIVLATQNPIEFEGTYPLPEAQLDRFLMRIAVGYPSADDEWRILEERINRRTDDVTISPVTDAHHLEGLRESIEDVYVSESIGRYIVAIVDATRSAPHVQVGASPRGGVFLLKLARARAFLSGRDFVTPDDVKSVAIPALAHRLSLRPDAWVTGIEPEAIVASMLDTVPTPQSDPTL